MKIGYEEKISLAISVISLIADFFYEAKSSVFFLAFIFPGIFAVLFKMIQRKVKDEREKKAFKITGIIMKIFFIFYYVFFIYMYYLLWIEEI